MIGEISKVGKILYLEVNAKGTLEKLPAIKWYAAAWLQIRQGFMHPMPVNQVREYAKRFKKVEK